MFSRLFIVFFFFFSVSSYALNPGDEAKDFSLMNQNGKMVKLSDYKGKLIVLEWFNHGCPYVKKHYNSGNMQTTQKTYIDNQDVVWLSIISSANGKQGHLKDAKEALSKMKEVGMKSNHLLLDHDGKVGQAYGAKTTPHMYIIGYDFKLAYVGAIDSIASADPSDIAKSTNYVTSSISKIMLKEKPSPSKTKPYGCSVKY